MHRLPKKADTLVNESSLVDVPLDGTDVPPPPISVEASVDLNRLRHNTRVLQKRAGNAALMGVVKANAYGHGLLRITRALQREGVHFFAVANLPEALRLRRAGVDDRILLFAAPLREYLPTYAEHDLEVTVSSPAVADAVIETARTDGPLRVHVKVETGMGRLGVPLDAAPDVLRSLAGASGVTLAGLWTHFATADEEDLAFTRAQLSRFHRLLNAVDDVPVEHLHVSNSAGLMALPDEVTDFAHPLVRTGLALYGIAPRPGMPGADQLRSAMRVTARLTHLKTVEPGATVSYGRTWQADRPTRIATVGAGYADGYPRLVSNRAEVGIRDRRYAVVGNVCMDMFMVDLGAPAPSNPGMEAEVGDEVVLFGEGGPSAHEVAGWAETIPYEVCTRVGPRVPRRYLTASPTESNSSGTYY